MNTHLQATIALETIRPDFKRMGIAIREWQGHLVFSKVGPDGKVSSNFVYYLAPLGTSINDEGKWTEFKVEFPLNTTIARDVAKFAHSIKPRHLAAP